MSFMKTFKPQMEHLYALAKLLSFFDIFGWQHRLLSLNYLWLKRFYNRHPKHPRIFVKNADPQFTSFSKITKKIRRANHLRDFPKSRLIKFPRQSAYALTPQLSRPRVQSCADGKKSIRAVIATVQGRPLIGPCALSRWQTSVFEVSVPERS